MKIKFSSATVAAVFLILLSAGCDRSQTIISEQLNVLGTSAELSIVGVTAEEARAIAEAVEEELLPLELVGYTLAPMGELHELNEAISQGRPMTVSDELRVLIEKARKLYRASGGRFNPAAGELVAMWEFRCDKDDCKESPYPEEVREMVRAKNIKVIAQRPSMNDIVLDGNTVSSRNRAVKLEFGDMIRGYALDKAIALLKKQKVRNAKIEIGGGVRCRGSRGEHRWWSQVWDASGNHDIGHVELGRNEAIVTVRAFDKSLGKPDNVYRHVVDPSTGAPVRDIQAVTVIHDSAAWASAAATAILVAGIRDWTSIAERMDLSSVMIITRNGTMYTSTAMEDRIYWDQRLEHQILVPRRR